MRQVLPAACGALLLIGCGQRLIPPPPSAADAPADETASPPQSPEDVHVTALRTPLRSGDQRIRLVNATLDADADEEQIVAFRPSGSNRTPISVGVVDFDRSSGNWRVAWEAVTQSTSDRTLTIAAVDLIDDPTPEIIVRGTAGDGAQTLDAYTRGDASGPQYQAIARISTAGTLDVTDRGESSADAVIITQVQDPQSQNALDLLRLTYAWESERHQFVLQRTERVPGGLIEDEQLRALFASSEPDTFERFLAGPWYREIPSRAIAGGNELEILTFDVANRSVSVYDGEIQEVYRWEISRRPLRRQLDVWVRNDSIDVIRKIVSVQVNADSELEVEVRSADRSDRRGGTYLRLTEELQRQLVSGPPPLPSPALSGTYTSGDSLHVDFAGDGFIWTEGGQTLAGAFVVRDRILSMKVIGPRGRHLGYRTYLVDYQEAHSPGRIVRTLVLTAAQPSAFGASAITEEMLHLAQTESVTEPLLSSP